MSESENQEHTQEVAKPTNNARLHGAHQNVSSDAEDVLKALLPMLVPQLEESRKASEEKEKRDRLTQILLEYWKAQYDFAKHLMTIGLAGMVTFGALLAGVYHPQDAMPLTYYFWIAIIFLLFLLTVIVAYLAAYLATSLIFELKDVANTGDLRNSADRHFKELERLFGRTLFGARLSLATALSLLLSYLFFFFPTSAGAF